MDTGKLLYICFWILTVYTLSFESAQSSHYEGGSVSWRHGKIYPEEDITEILIDFRVAWRRSNSNHTSCDQDGVKTGKLLRHDVTDNYEWKCQYGCEGSAPFDGVYCTEFDEEDDWSLGSRTLAFNISGILPFTMEFQGCCWISSLVYISPSDAEWSLLISGALGNRSDTNRPNNSPIATAMPAIRFQAGCPDSVDLPMYDQDGDDVKCELAVCDDVSCNDYPYLKLTQQGQNCRISYNAGGPGNTVVAISILIKDYPSKSGLKLNDTLISTSTAISMSSLQFLIRIINDDHACKLRPQWVEPSFPNGFVKAAVVDQLTNIPLNISSETELSVKVVGPPGVSVGVTDENPFYSGQLTFTPNADHLGPNTICITAKDSNGKMSEHRCLTLIVGAATSPCDIGNGGCSDDCEAAGFSYVCSCSRSCWRLADDRRKCIPEMVSKCNPEGFEISLPVCAIGPSAVKIGFFDQLNGVSVSTDAPCETEVVGANHVKKFKYNECLTQRQTDFTEIHFRNQLRMWIDDEDMTFPGSGEEKITITRGYWYNIQLVCSFSKYSNVNASFRPQDKEEGLVLVPGLGSFQFYFDFYMDENFKAAYSPYAYPITVTVNSDIYFGIRTVGSTGLEVFTEKCVAMTTATPTENTVSYTMIDKGCSKDTTLEKYNGTNSLEERFSIKAFRFQDNLNTDSSVNIYIQCSAVLCVIGQDGTKCQKGCVTSRKRRDANDEIFVEHSIDSRSKREVGDSQPPTISTNISESNTFDIQVSGPFRIEVVQTEGNPPVTVATPTSLDNVKPTAQKPATSPATIKSTTKPKEDKEPEKVESFIVIAIASSVGGVVVLVLLCLLVVLILYYNIALKPRHKVIPDKNSTVTARTLSAWTIDEEEEYPRPYFTGGGKTPPPSFWEVERMDS